MRKGTPYQPRNFLHVSEQTNPTPFGPKGLAKRFDSNGGAISPGVRILHNSYLSIPEGWQGGACALLAVMAHCDRSATLDRI